MSDMITPGEFIDLVAGVERKKPPAPVQQRSERQVWSALATVDPEWDGTSMARVQFDNENEITARSFPVINAGVEPGHRVMMVKVGTGWVIAGSLTPTPASGGGGVTFGPSGHTYTFTAQDALSTGNYWNDVGFAKYLFTFYPSQSGPLSLIPPDWDGDGPSYGPWFYNRMQYWIFDGIGPGVPSGTYRSGQVNPSRNNQHTRGIASNKYFDEAEAYDDRPTMNLVRGFPYDVYVYCKGYTEVGYKISLDNLYGMLGGFGEIPVPEGEPAIVPPRMPTGYPQQVSLLASGTYRMQLQPTTEHGDAEFSHYEGGGHSLNGSFAHVEGGSNTADGLASHAEGIGTISSGQGSHSEGNNTQAGPGVGAHAEGNSTSALGAFSHSRNSNTLAQGLASSAGGYYTQAEALASETKGIGARARDHNAMAHGGVPYGGPDQPFRAGPYQFVRRIVTCNTGNSIATRTEPASIVPRNRAMAVRAMAVGRTQDGVDVGYFTVTALFKSDSVTPPNVTTVGTPVVTKVAGTAGTSSWTCAMGYYRDEVASEFGLLLNSSNGGDISGNKTVNWTVVLETAEMGPS